MVTPSLLARLAKDDRYGAITNIHDLLKAIALVTMVIDHLGAFLYVDEPWLRVIGRTAFPIYLFLVGYDGKFRFVPSLPACAIVILIGRFAFHRSILPLDILFTIMLTRLFFGWMDRQGWLNRPNGNVIVGCLILTPGLIMLIDYGAVAFWFALAGVAARRTWPSHWPCGLLIAAFAAHTVFTQIGYEFQLPQLCVTILIYLLVGSSLYRSDPYQQAAVPIGLLGRILSRQSLWIYTAHILILQWAAHSGDWFPPPEWLHVQQN